MNNFLKYFACCRGREIKPGEDSDDSNSQETPNGYISSSKPKREHKYVESYKKIVKEQEEYDLSQFIHFNCTQLEVSENPNVAKTNHNNVR